MIANFVIERQKIYRRSKREYRLHGSSDDRERVKSLLEFAAAGGPRE